MSYRISPRDELKRLMRRFVGHTIILHFCAVGCFLLAFWLVPAGTTYELPASQISSIMVYTIEVCTTLGLITALVVQGSKLASIQR